MTNIFSLEGKNAWVTGAAYGIGFAIAEVLLQPHVAPTPSGGGSSSGGWRDDDDDEKYKNKNRKTYRRKGR